MGSLGPGGKEELAGVTSDSLPEMDALLLRMAPALSGWICGPRNKQAVFRRGLRKWGTRKMGQALFRGVPETDKIVVENARVAQELL
jgi:hypothetical protein